MKESVLFVHGMFQNAKSWENWRTIFSSSDYECIIESWPLHEGEPSDLRRNPPSGLGDLRLQTVIDKFAGIIRQKGIKPVVIGHSVGGLIVQKLAEMDLIKAGVAICSVAPNRMLTLDWSFFKNSIQIANPIVGDSIFEMTPEGFYNAFANTLSKDEALLAYEQFATHDSRNILRDCMLETGQINLKTVRAPLLFLAADKDEIIPADLCEKNAKAYRDVGATADYAVFKNRSHYICGEPGWQAVAKHAHDWLGSIVQTLPLAV